MTDGAAADGPSSEHSRDARTRRVLVFVALSLGLHGTVVPLSLALRGLHLLGDGRIREPGDLGASGAGGARVDFSVTRAAPTPANAAQAPATPPAATEPSRVEPPERRATHDRPATNPRSANVATTATPDASAASSDASTVAQVTPPDPVPGESGMVPGSIAQQRSLLPRAAHCADPVAGIWRSHKYFRAWGDWMVATLYIDRDGPNHLRGRIVAHQWDGGPMDIHPPACGPDGFEFTVEEPASGRLEGQHVDFGAITYRIRGFACRNAHRDFDYNPDTFAGTIDPQRNEFQSRLNDGGRARDEPMLFRRIACETGGAANPGARP